MIGITHRSECEAWLERRPARLDFLEVQAEPFTRAFSPALRWLADRYPLVIRCSSLSIGGPDVFEGPQLSRCLDAIAVARPRRIAVPLGFSRAGEIDLGVSVPISLTNETLGEVADRVKRLQDRGRAPVAIENIASPIRIRGSVESSEYLGRLVETTGCVVRVDLDSLLLDSRRHGVDPAAWLRAMDGSRVTDVRLTATLARDLRNDAALLPVLRAVKGLPDAAWVLGLPEATAPAAIERGLEALDALC